jgi:hypothetical protein
MDAPTVVGDARNGAPPRPSQRGRAVARGRSKSGTATATRKRSDSNGKAVEPKLGARAKRRYADLRKEIGATEAEGVLKAASEKAVQKCDRIIRLEYLFAAQDMKMPAHAEAHYGKTDVVLGTFDPATPRKGSGRGTRAATTPRGKTPRASQRKQASAPKERARKTATSARKSRAETTAKGSSSPRNGGGKTRAPGGKPPERKAVPAAA